MEAEPAEAVRKNASDAAENSFPIAPHVQVIVPGGIELSSTESNSSAVRSNILEWQNPAKAFPDSFHTLFNVLNSQRTIGKEDVFVTKILEAIERIIFSDKTVASSSTQQNLCIDWIRFALLAAILGWTQSDPTESIPSTNNNSNKHIPLSLCCEVCNQRIDLTQYVNNAFRESADGTRLCFPSSKSLDLLKAHRYFCPFINPQYLNGEEEPVLTASEKNPLGWELSATVFREEFRHMKSTANKVHISSIIGRKRGLEEDTSSNSNQQQSQSIAPQTTNTASDFSPENVYKKIRSVLYDALN
jgi:hypothetical protein